MKKTIIKIKAFLKNLSGGRASRERERPIHIS